MLRLRGRAITLIAMYIGCTTSPAKKSATHKEAKNRFEIVRKDWFLYNNHSTTAFPMTAAKPEEANHNERTMDAALLSLSSKPQLIFMSSFTTGNERCISQMKVVLLKTTKYAKKEIMQNRLIVKLTKMVLVPVTTLRLKISVKQPLTVLST